MKYKTIALLLLFLPTMWIWGAINSSAQSGSVQKLVCFPIDRPDLFLNPEPGRKKDGTIIEGKNGVFRSSCGYFSQPPDYPGWKKHAFVTAIWMGKNGGKQFDCSWEKMKNTRNFLVSEKKQAYVNFSHGHDMNKHTARKIAEDLLAQAERLAIDCPEKTPEN